MTQPSPNWLISRYSFRFVGIESLDRLLLRNVTQYSDPQSEAPLQALRIWCRYFGTPTTRKAKLVKGIVKWFNADKGYGFIEPEGGGKDVFVHASKVQEAGLQKLDNNQPIEFEMVDGLDGRQMAGNLSVVAGDGEAG